MVTWGKGQIPIPIGWLPPAFKAQGSDLYGSTMVTGGENSEVLTLKLPTSMIIS